MLDFEQAAESAPDDFPSVPSRKATASRSTAGLTLINMMTLKVAFSSQNVSTINIQITTLECKIV